MRIRFESWAALAAIVLWAGAGLACAGSVWASERFGPEEFGIYSLQSSLYKDEAETELATQAGSHPDALVVNLEFNHELIEETEYRYGPKEEKHSGEFFDNVRVYGDPRDVIADLPRGLVVDPSATPIKCNEAELLGTLADHTCPPESAVGILNTRVYGGGFITTALTSPVYNMVTPPDKPAELGVNIAGLGLVLHIGGDVRTGGDYGLTGAVSGIGQVHMVFGSTLTLWGDPSAASHDPWRGVCAERNNYRNIEEFGVPSCPVAHTNTPLLTMPTSCPGTPLEFSAHADSWQEPGVFKPSPPSVSPPVTECSSLDFSPAIEVQPETTSSDSPTGLRVDLHIPQSEDLSTLAEANLKDAVVTLPEGMVVNPSSADGLQGCSSEQVDLHGEGPSRCPDASKIGSVTVSTPLLERPLPGSVYIAKQSDNPFGSLLAIYVVVEGQGVIVKLAGHVEADPVTGRLRTTFAENPQLPWEDFKLHFFGGPRAPLTTPPTCGTYTTVATLTPWSGTDPVPLAGEPNSFTVATSPNDAGCAHALAEEPNHPGFVAGTVSSIAGSFSAFVLKLEREDGSQVFEGVNVTLPPGLTGKLAGIPFCAQSQIEAAERATGTEEQSSPSCPAASQVGTVSVGAGSGAPFYASGRAYLAGPYKGAPFSLAIVTPAVAGPFDLGTVVVRSALYVDPHTAQVTVKSDPLPMILQGIPLDIRNVAVSIDRPQFTLNPTSCEPMAITGTLLAQSSQAPLSSVYQATHCASLKFKPSFKVSTSGKTSRKNGASLHVRLTYPNAPFGTQANIHSVHVELPRALPSRLSTLNHACPESVFNQNPAGCPSQSRVGLAKAVTPVLPVPLEGPAYFVSHGGQKFPELIMVLQGYGVTIDLAGETFISKAGITSSTFKSVPDVPVGSFELTLPQGPYSALGANTDLCAASLTMPTVFNAQNGARLKRNTPIEVQGCPYSLRILGRRIHKGTLTLKVSVPVAGRLVASGQGVSKASKSAKGRQTLTLTLKERQAGKLSTKITLRFTPKGVGGKRAKPLRKSLMVTFS